MENIFQKPDYPFSFWNGLFSFFWMPERRIDRIRTKLDKNQECSPIKDDWIKVGGDLKSAFDKIKQEEKFEELQDA